MSYLATNGIIHRDLAARNVLLSKDVNVHVKLADFAKAVMATTADGYQDESLLNDHDTRFNIRWTAPEVFQVLTIISQDKQILKHFWSSKINSGVTLTNFIY